MSVDIKLPDKDDICIEAKCNNVSGLFLENSCRTPEELHNLVNEFSKAVKSATNIESGDMWLKSLEVKI